MQKIIIVSTRKVPTPSINEELKWIGESLGLFNLRDKNSSCFRIFIVLLRKARAGKIITSDEIAVALKLTRGTVVHHLNMLMGAGIVVREQGGYILRENNLKELITEIKRDVDRAFDEIIKVAEHIDRKL